MNSRQRRKIEAERHNKEYEERKQSGVSVSKGRRASSKRTRRLLHILAATTGAYGGHVDERYS